MKLSEIRGERVLDVIAEIIEPIANIAEDDDAAALFKPESVPDGMTAWEFFLKRVKRSLPPLLKTHKEDFVAIMASVNGKTPKEYMEGMTLASLLSDIVELITDKEFTSFFG